MSHEQIRAEADLVDLSGLSLADLRELDDSVLAHALRRILADAERPEEAVAAFESYIDGIG
ncbi:MAG: FxSxx-COOH cyclophane-containing RiPP peptide [Pseudonocardiaceae bacterium]